MKLFLFTTVLSSFHVFGQENIDAGLAYRKSNYQINGDYKAGNFLIYNCDKEYYTCVDSDGFNKCKEKRQQSIEGKKALYACAPLKEFSNKEKCGEKNYEVVESLAKKRFCYPKN